MISFREFFQELLNTIVLDNEQHAKWINTLSYLENCGARKIAACEHPTLVKEEMLKHAAEEFRHAHYLKSQIKRISAQEYDSYKDIMGGCASRHYLNALDARISRYLQKYGQTPDQIKEAAYILVTYAIEQRASELYPLYETVLRQAKSKVTVKSILLEEKEHLEEMIRAIQELGIKRHVIDKVCEMESALCQKWLVALGKLHDISHEEK